MVLGRELLVAGGGFFEFPAQVVDLLKEFEFAGPKCHPMLLCQSGLQVLNVGLLHLYGLPQL